MMALVEKEQYVLPITLKKLLKKQCTDPFCKDCYAEIGDTTSLFDVRRDGVSVRRGPRDGARQKMVPATFRARVLYLSHYPPLAGRPGGSPMYFTMRREFCWPHTANDAFQTVADGRFFH